MHPSLTKEYLYQKYEVEQMSQLKIAEEIGIKHWQVSEAMKYHGIESRPTGKTRNLVGERFGRLVVIRPMYRRETKSAFRWKCLCDCGNESDVRSGNLMFGITKSCGCIGRELRGPKQPNWKGYGHIPGNFMSKSKTHAKRRKIEYNLSIEYLNKLFVNQEGNCALSGVELSFEYYGYKSEFATASLDRIDSAKGYVEGNVQWVHKDFNFMKQSMSMEKFLESCKKVIEYNEKKTKNLISK